jgi:hypothetical protein
MPRRKRAVSFDDDETRLTRNQPGKLQDLAVRWMETPAVARFMMTVLTSLICSAIFCKSTAGITVEDFAHVSKHLQGRWEIAGLIGWRAVEIAIVWVPVWGCECSLRLKFISIEIINPHAI